MRLNRKTRRILSKIGIGIMYAVGGIAGVLVTALLITVAVRGGIEIKLGIGLPIMFLIGGLLAVIFDEDEKND